MLQPSANSALDEFVVQSSVDAGRVGLVGRVASASERIETTTRGLDTPAATSFVGRAATRPGCWIPAFASSGGGSSSQARSREIKPAEVLEVGADVRRMRGQVRLRRGGQDRRALDQVLGEQVLSSGGLVG